MSSLNYLEQLPPSFKPPYPDENQGPLLLKTVWVLIVISTVVVAARLYVKTMKTRRLYWDDGLVVLALALGYVHAGSISHAVQTGLGRHMIYLDPASREATIRIGLLALASGFLSPMVGRIGFCVTLLFLSSTDPRVKKWPVYAAIVLQVTANVLAIVVFYTQCGTEIDILWNPAKASLFLTKCENPRIQTYYGYVQGSLNTATDAFLTVLPAVLIEHTALSLRNKIILALLLCLSILAMIASIVKTYEAKSLSEVLDYTYDLCVYVIWIATELNVVIIVSSVPLLRLLFQRRSDPRARWKAVNLGSVLSKKGPREGTTERSSRSSEENVLAPHRQPYSDVCERAAITVTTEVSVTYQPNNAPFVHAALVGLVQGEIANPSLMRR